MRIYLLRILTFLLLIFVFTIQINAQYNLSVVSEIEYPAGYEMSGCWGYTDDTGNEYAIIGTSMGTSIVDITTPEVPEELFFVPGVESIWREAKVWNHHAYISTEGADEGMLIIDLNDLPLSIDTFYFKGDDTHPFSTAHTLFIDENGYCYLFGFGTAGGYGGAYIVDLNPDPKNPVYVGAYTESYIHDGYVRNDTLWAAEIYDGRFEVLDVSNKTDIILMGTQNTGASAAHNCWLSDDGKYLFTTDEINYGFIESYNVEDLTDIVKLDGVKHGDPDSTVAHNVYYLNGYLVTAHYTEGVTIHDAHKTGNLIEVAHYDTSPFGPTSGYGGVWGVYPYFESGNIVATDRIGTTFILQPNYERACYLEGTITNEITGSNIYDATVNIIATSAFDNTSVSGKYKTGYYASGIYDIEISHPDCDTKIINSIELIQGVTTELNETLDCGNIAVPEIFKNIDLNVFYSAENKNITIKYNLYNAGSAEVLLINASGQIISSFGINGSGEQTINGNSLAPGCYILRFNNDSFSQNKKIMVY